MSGQSPTNSGYLYGIGVGPGDPELLTLKAQRLLRRVEVICFTQLDDGRESKRAGTAVSRVVNLSCRRAYPGVVLWTKVLLS